MNMTSKYRHAITVAAVLGACSAARAQSIDYAALEQLFGEPITTSATGSPQRASDVPATMEIITAEEIRRSGARDIPGILRHVTGVDVLQTSNDHADASVRGYNQAFSPRLLVLLDGRQVYADYYGFTPWSTLPIELEAIRQIEVVKGPNSALFGFNAVGGVINIITYHPLEAPASSVSVSAGTQDLAQGAAVSTLRLGENAGLRISAGLRDNDDFSTPLRPSEAGTRRGNDREAFNLDGVVRLTDGVQMDFGATYSAADHVEFSPILTMNYARYETHSFKAHLTADTSLGLLQATLYRNDISTDIYLGSDTTTFLALDNDVTVAQVQSLSKLANDHTLRLSAEYRDNSVNTTPLTGAEVAYDVVALGAMWEWNISPTFTWTNALRTDRLSLGRSGMIPAGYGLTNQDWDRTHTESSFNSGLVWHLGERDTLRFMAGRGVQSPNLLNLGALLVPIPGVGYATGVPTLEPTVVTNFEVAWDRSLPTVRAELHVGLFHGHTRDIVANTGGAQVALGLVSTSVNIGRSETTGLEISVDGTIGEAWRWGLGYAAQDIEDDFDPGFSVTTTLVDFEHTTPRHMLNANLGWSNGVWEIDGYLRYQSSFDGIENPGFDVIIGALTPISSYVSVDARVGYRLNERLTLALSGQNLTDSTQRQTAAAEAERRVLGTLTLRL
jgi:iron complex outermembrane receptor protein